MRFGKIIGGTGVWVVVAFGMVSGAILLEWVAQISGGSWNWDVNHFMYFGQQIINGDLHWTVEFDDKLPINQFLFAIPAALNSYTAWQMMSLLAMIGGAFAAASIVSFELKKHLYLSASIRRQSACFAALATLFGFTFSFGGIHQINGFAGSAMIAAIALLQRYQTGLRSRAVAVIALSALLASVAAGIRPYYVLVVLAAPFWVFCWQLPTVSLKSRSAMAVLWIALVGAFGVLANVFPYVVSGQLDVFLDGLNGLRETLIPSTMGEILNKQESAFRTKLMPGTQVVILMSIALSIFVVTILLRSVLHRGGAEVDETLARLGLDMLMLSAVFPILIELAILQKHFWPHYLQVFVPFFAIGAAFFVALIAHEMSRKGTGNLRQLLNALAASILLFFVVPLAVHATRSISSHILSPDEPDDDLAALIAVFDEQLLSRQSFLVPEAMYPHVMLNEPRRGFPHAANVGFILNGWWHETTLPARFGLPSDAAGLCTKIENEGPTVVVAMSSPLLNNCLKNSSVYHLHPRSSDTEISSKAYKFYVRQ